MGDSAVSKVLFLCTGNSCRSILAECILNRLGEGRFMAFSAGSHPAGDVHPMAVALLDSLGYPTGGLRSKSWSEFSNPGAPSMDFVVTVCDQAAGETCPLWPGAPMIAHWGFPDPAKFAGEEEQTRAFFRAVYDDIQRLLADFVALPVTSMPVPALRQKLLELEAQAPQQRR